MRKKLLLINPKNFVVEIFLFQILVANIFGLGSGSTRVNFLKISPGARPASLGESYAGLGDDVYSVWYNPASLVLMKEQQQSFSHIEWLEGIKYDWLGYACPIKQKVKKEYKFFEKVLVESFDDTKDTNFLGGTRGSWNDKENGGRSELVTEYVSQNQGYCYKISYKIYPLGNNKSGYAGVWFGLNKVSINNKTAISFLVKGTNGTEKFQLGLKDSSGKEVKVDISNYGKITTDWQKFVIPMDDFFGIDFTEMDNISFTFLTDDNRPNEGTIYLDEIEFVGNKTVNQTFAISYGLLDTGPMKHLVEVLVPPYYEEKEMFNSTEMVFVISYAREIVLKEIKIPVGLNIKLLSERLYQKSVYGSAIDFGIVYVYPYFDNRTIFSFSVQNIGYLDSIENETDILPTNIIVGVGYKFKNINFGVDLNIPVDVSPRLNLGVEYWLFKKFIFRAGYMFGRDIGEFTTGIGVRWNKFGVDYAYVPYEQLGNTHRLSLNLFFK
jgi:hypothetical protein